MKNLAIIAAVMLLASCSHMGMSGSTSSGSSDMRGMDSSGMYQNYGGIPYPDAYGVNSVLIGPPAGP